MSDDKTSEPAVKETTEAPAADTSKTEVKPSEDKPSRTMRAQLKKELGKAPDQDAKKPEVEKKPVKEVKPAAKIEAAEPVAAAPAAPVQTFEPILAPADMNAEEKEAFSKLAPEAQRFLARRAHEYRADYTRKTEALAQAAREIRGLEGLNLSQVRDEYAKRNLSLPTVIESAILWDQEFRRDKVNAAKQYLQLWGVTPEQLGVSTNYPAGQPAAAQGQTFQPEQVGQLVEQEVTKRIEQDRQSRHVQACAAAIQSIKEREPLFRDPGTAEQLETVLSPIVAGLAQANPGGDPAKLLDEALSYVKAGHPVFRELTQKLEAGAAANQRQQEATQAKLAARTISGGPGSGSPTKSNLSMRQALRLARNNQL